MLLPLMVPLSVAPEEVTFVGAFVVTVGAAISEKEMDWERTSPG